MSCYEYWEREAQRHEGQRGAGARHAPTPVFARDIGVSLLHHQDGPPPASHEVSQARRCERYRPILKIRSILTCRLEDAVCWSRLPQEESGAQPHPTGIAADVRR